MITRISLSRPKVQRLQLVEKDGKKVVQAVATQPQRRQVRRTAGRQRPQRQQQTQPQGIPIVTVKSWP
ncbi:MAG: hypothetical protein Q9N34_09555 [Aquificota bacterium]|nr:hypothetical protein [Aquificota bacterium]